MTKTVFENYPGSTAINDHYKNGYYIQNLDKKKMMYHKAFNPSDALK